MVAATCEMDGISSYECECGEYYTEEVAAKNHQYIGNTCTECGEIYSLGLEYALDYSGKYYTVVGLGECEDSNIVIPSVYEGLPVCEIGDEAFEDSSIRSVKIPVGIQRIGEGAFTLCYMLNKIQFNATSCNDFSLSTNVGAFDYAGKWTNGITVTIGANVKKIPSYLFFPTYSETVPNVTKVIFEEGSVCEEIKNSAFRMCSKLTSVFIGENVKKIGFAAFEKTSISILTIPDNVETIDEYAFQDCASMTKVTIGANVRLIEATSFKGCDNLKTAIFKTTTGWRRPYYDYENQTDAFIEIEEENLEKKYGYILTSGYRLERS